MSLIVMAPAICMGAAGTSAFAGEPPVTSGTGEDAGTKAAPACLTAEVNPVTGHVFCIDPLGAPVEPPPPSSEFSCKSQPHANEAWTYGSGCKS